MNEANFRPKKLSDEKQFDRDVAYQRMQHAKQMEMEAKHNKKMRRITISTVLLFAVIGLVIIILTATNVISEYQVAAYVVSGVLIALPSIIVMYDKSRSNHPQGKHNQTRRFDGY